jgi:hypothetical protein
MSAWFAHRTERGFVHVMPSRMAVEMCGPGEIVDVEVSEDPDFTEGAMRRGAGRRLRVRVVAR